MPSPAGKSAIACHWALIAKRLKKKSEAYRRIEGRYGRMLVSVVDLEGEASRQPIGEAPVDACFLIIRLSFA